VVKLLILLHRRPDFTVPEFRRYVEETHLPLVMRMPGLRRVAVNWSHPEWPAGIPGFSDGDGVAEDWFDSIEALRAALASPEGQAVAADGPKHLDMSRTKLLVAEEQEIALPDGAVGAGAGAEMGMGTGKSWE
jgi:uncharacterized protein (TIGR02118 family)